MFEKAFAAAKKTISETVEKTTATISETVEKTAATSSAPHFSHPGPEHWLVKYVEQYWLGLQWLRHNEVIKCAICTLNILDVPVRACSKCKFFLHEECAKLPERLLQNPFHPAVPAHPLTLQPIQNHDFRCHACHQLSIQRSGFCFRCGDCNLNLDLECAFIRPATEKTEEQHSSHQHPLVLVEKMPNDLINCRLCGEYCSDPSYGCFPCSIFLHRLCYERNLPGKIQHFFHTCPLTLYTYNPEESKFRSCRACYKPLSPGLFYYGCRECRFGMHVDCTLLATEKSTSNQEQIRHHFLHGHPLSRNEIKNDDTNVIICYACMTRCTNPTYACLQPSCSKKVYICKTCIELPKEICHPFHPYHPLTLLQQYHDHLQHIDWTVPLPGSVCNACRKETGIVVYSCQSEICSFRLHVGCSGIRDAIEYEAHNHLLQFKEIIDGHQLIKCSACNSTCNSYAFSCLHCDNFNLHHTCGPLPSTIKDKCHIHPLILTHSLAEHENQRNNEFYCDACEEERDPELPIYQCMECHFAAEIKCVISEVKSRLDGEYGEVELRNSLGQLGKVITKDAAKEMVQKKEQFKSTLTWETFLSTLNEDEKKEADLLWVRILESTHAEEIKPYDHEEIIMFSDKAYTQFMEFLNHSKVSQDMFPCDWDIGSHLNEELVNVRDYVTSRKLDPILKDLLSNHGDIGAKSTISPKVKSLYFCLLCECINRTRSTKVVDTTDDILLGWWRCLKILQSAGFKIEFAFDRLKIVTDAHFGLYVEKQVDNTLHQLDRDIEELTRKRERVKSAKSAKYSLNIDKCLREASELRERKVIVASRLL